jgi:hypothetical protein
VIARRTVLRTGAAFVAAAALGALPAGAQAAEEGAPTWASEQPAPPPPEPGQPRATRPVGLGTVGDIEFFAPNRGLLITSGNGTGVNATVKPGVWSYNGAEWHEIATQCGAAEGEEAKIAWAAPGQFWTVSTGRTGQRSESTEITKLPPLIDNTLCHFKGGQIVGSYAHPAFRADSYLKMHAAACIDPSDCWFGGEALEEPQFGAFQLHWNGTALEEQAYPNEGHAIADLVSSEGTLFESALLTPLDRSISPNAEPPVVRRINPEGFEPVLEPEQKLPLYGSAELPTKLEALRLSATEGTVWAAAGRKREVAGEEQEANEKGLELGQVTVLRRYEGVWSQLIGPGARHVAAHPLPAVLPTGEEQQERQLLGTRPEENQGRSTAANAVVSSIAAEPGGESAWIALRGPGSASSREPTRAVMVQVNSEGKVLQTVTLPSKTEEESTHIGPKGAAAFVTCPGTGNCWMTTTQGWLFHLAAPAERTLPRDAREGEYFCPQHNYPECIITSRPADQGLPQQPPDAPPPDTSGIVEEGLRVNPKIEEQKAPPAESNQVTLPLLSHMRSKLGPHDSLELSFHLSVKARMRLIAKRHSKTVASTARHVFGAGNHKLVLRLNPKEWPTKIKLEAHPLAPLIVTSSVTGEGATVGTESTGLSVLPHSALLGDAGFLP